MENLTNSVLDFLLYLATCEEDECDPDYTLKLLESLSYQIQNNYNNEERQSLSDAARSRLNQSSPAGEEKQLLEAIATGRFDGYEMDE